VESIVVTDPKRDWTGTLQRVYDAVSSA
jgi:hypothetical protein